MNTENLRRLFFTAMGVVGTALAPTLPYILLCTAAVLGDCLSAYLLSRRVKKAYPNADRETGKFMSYHFGKTIWTLLCVYALLIFAHFLEMYVTESLPFNALKVAAGAVIFWQGWSILENCSSCNGAKWAKLLQKIMIDKTERHLDVDLSDLKQHGADSNAMAGDRSASPASVINTFIGDNKPSGVVPEPGSLMLRLERTALKAKYTIGHLYYIAESGSKVYICDVVEDKVRDLNKNGKFDNGEVKIKSQTAIPYGTYKVTLNVKSPKFSNFVKYPYAKKYNGYLPRLLNVPSFEGILIHCGSSANSSAGCLIVGYNKVVGRVVDSQKAFYYLMDKYLVPAKERGETITLEIV